MKHTEIYNDQFGKDDFDFSSLPNYIKSLQKKFGLSTEETELFFWLIEMYDKKRFTNPRFEL